MRKAKPLSGLVYNLILGGEHLSDLEVLRGDPGTQELLDAEGILAPTTAGEFLRKFDIGDVHDLQRVHLRLQERVRPHQQATTCTIDLDSSIYEQASTHKEGSTKAYNGEVGYHPLFAFWAEEGELLFSHLRRGSAHTARNVLWFLRQTRKRVPETADKKLRADSGFYSHRRRGVVRSRGLHLYHYRRSNRALTGRDYRRCPSGAGNPCPSMTWRRWPNCAISPRAGRIPTAT